MVIPKNGYIYIYVANESPTDVYFDNLQIIHEKSNVLELSDYYPYGLRNESLSYTGLSFDPANNYHYQDKEFQTALGLNMHEFGLRHYDATLGRWGVQDPFMQFYNPYLAMGNNPVSIVDPTGGIGFSSQGNPKRATYDDPEYYRGGGGGRGIATVGGPMGWGQVGVSAWSNDFDPVPDEEGNKDYTSINEGAITAYFASVTGTNQFGVGADGQSNYGNFSAWQSLVADNAANKNEPTYSTFIGPDQGITLPTTTIEALRIDIGIVEKLAQEHYGNYNYTQGGGGDPYANQYGKSAISLSQFQSEYSGCYENEIITGQSSKFGYTFPNKIAGNGAFVKLGNGREVDMTHFMVVGRRGHLMGFANEITQMGTNSFFYPQDLYSNRLGINFFNSYGSLINQNPSMISTYTYWFLSNPNNINFTPIQWERGPKY